jgi:mycofactocin biosynthesis protein MftB
MGCAVSTEPSGSPSFDLDRPWRLDERVAVRPEPFGALLYHYGTRRLSFLKSPTVLTVLRSLADHPSARAACAAAGVDASALPAYERALATLAGSQMIRQRTAS